MNYGPGNIIKSLSRGLTALDLVVEESLTPQRLAKSLDVDRTTAYRILNTLAAHDFVLRDPLDDQYVANVRKVFSFAHTVVGQVTLSHARHALFGTAARKNWRSRVIGGSARRGCCVCQPHAK